MARVRQLARRPSIGQERRKTDFETFLAAIRAHLDVIHALLSIDNVSVTRSSSA
jgi:hypothetical protein